jgi:uncharacterized protein (UPF0210 family)
MSSNGLFKVRAITAFVKLEARDFVTKADHNGSKTTSGIVTKMQQCNELLLHVASVLSKEGYIVQTLRIATNPFGEWLLDMDAAGNYDNDVSRQRLQMLDDLLVQYNVPFCALGPARNVSEIAVCPKIIAMSPRFSCSASVNATDVTCAAAAAECILQISQLGQLEEGTGLDYLVGGLGNFRFCTISSCSPYIPFFPAAQAGSIHEDNDGTIHFAIGLENGALVRHHLNDCKSIANISTIFSQGMTQALLPLQTLCDEAAKQLGFSTYLGIDSSLNPSLDDGGSIAQAIELLEEVQRPFGGPGTLAAAAALTTAIQSLPNIQLTGYCGLMLPLCEDQRLAELASADDSSKRLQIHQLLNISNVCGVGVDTVPVAGDCSTSKLAALILDVAAIAGRWNKSLSCRVFPVPGGMTGDYTTFDSPYLCNARILDL